MSWTTCVAVKQMQSKSNDILGISRIEYLYIRNYDCAPLKLGNE